MGNVKKYDEFITENNNKKTYVDVDKLFNQIEQIQGNTITILNKKMAEILIYENEEVGCEFVGLKKLYSTWIIEIKMITKSGGSSFVYDCPVNKEMNGYHLNNFESSVYSSILNTLSNYGKVMKRINQS